MTRPFFTRERITDFDIYDRNCDLAFAHSKKRLAEGYSIDVQVNYQQSRCKCMLDPDTDMLLGPSWPFHS